MEKFEKNSVYRQTYTNNYFPYSLVASPFALGQERSNTEILTLGPLVMTVKSVVKLCYNNCPSLIECERPSFHPMLGFQCCQYDL